MRKDALYSKISMTCIIACFFACGLNNSWAEQTEYEKQQIKSLSFGLLSKAKPVLGKGKPDDMAKLPDNLKNLNGKLVRITGALLLSKESWYIDKPVNFFAVSQNSYGCPCCFWGPQPTVFNTLIVTVKKGHEIRQPFSPQVVIEGILHIEPEYEDGELVGLYSISEATVKKKGNTIF